MGIAGPDRKVFQVLSRLPLVGPPFDDKQATGGVHVHTADIRRSV